MTPVTRALLRAAADGDVNLIKGLLAQDTYVDAANKAGQTALMLAAAFKRSEVVSLLLTSGADVEARDELGLTALDWAGESRDIIELLTRAPSIPEPEPAPTDEIPQPEIPPTPPVIPLNRLVVRREEVRTAQHHEGTALKGLAAAILRDHLSKSNANSTHTYSPPNRPSEVLVDEQPNSVHQVEPVSDSTPSEQFVEPITAKTTSEHFFEPVIATTTSEQFDEPINASTASDEFAEPNTPTASELFEPVIATTTSDHFEEPINAPTAFDEFAESSTPTASDEFVEPMDAAIASEQLVEPINASTPSDQFAEPFNAPTAPDQFVEPMNASTPSEKFVEPIKASTASEAFAEPVNTPTAYDQFADNTLGGTETEFNDDTAAPKTRPMARPRIFDLEPSQEFPKPIRKVEVPVPSFTSASSKSGVVVWTLVIVVLAVGGFGGYRLASYLLASRSTSASSSATTPAAPPPQPATVAPKKSAPVVGGELVGAELHLPDAVYPPDSTQSITGKVTVQVRVSKKGMVVRAKAIDGDESLKTAAEDAAKRSAFSPEKLQGKPPVLDGTITYHFIPPQQLGTEATRPSTEDNTAKRVSIKTGGPLAGTELNLKEPGESSAKGVTGTITVVVRVSRGGRVVSWRPLDGDSRLRSLAVNAAKLSSFSPDKLPGTGDVVGTITYTFR